MAKEQGLSLTGPDGLLKQLTKSVIETALDEEMTDHLGYAKHDRAGIGAENIRNGTRPKTVLPANTGPVQIDVPSGLGDSPLGGQGFMTLDCTAVPTRSGGLRRGWCEACWCCTS